MYVVDPTPLVVEKGFEAFLPLVGDSRISIRVLVIFSPENRPTEQVKYF